MSKHRLAGATLLLLLTFLLTMGCGAGEGSLKVTVWGEDFVEKKIPADEVKDGWTIEFKKLLVVFGNVQLKSANGITGPGKSETKLFDLKQKGPHLFGEWTTPSATWDAMSYSIIPATGATTSGNAADTDLAMMKSKGFSIYVEGTATKGKLTKTFAWGWATSTTYTECKSKAVVAANGTATAQLTFHADHFFYDHLESNDADVRFDAIANADSDGDGKITQKELKAVSGRAFQSLNHYNVGRFSTVDNLNDFIQTLTRTVGHIDGEGHCNIAN
jgi:hypothetical protein